MKTALLNIILLSSLGLAGCSTNTRTENTAAGVVTGAIVGGFTGNAVGRGTGHTVAISTGSVVGALIGAAIGYYIDSTDHRPSDPIPPNNPAQDPRRLSAHHL